MKPKKKTCMRCKSCNLFQSSQFNNSEYEKIYEVKKIRCKQNTLPFQLTTLTAHTVYNFRDSLFWMRGSEVTEVPVLYAL